MSYSQIFVADASASPVQIQACQTSQSWPRFVTWMRQIAAKIEKKVKLAIAMALVCLGAQAAPAPLTWSSTDHSEFTATSGASATRLVGGGAYQLSRSDTPQSVGVRTVAISVTSIGSLSGVSGPGLLLGVGNTKSPTNVYAGFDNNGVSLSWNGNVYKGGGYAGVSLSSYTTGDVIGMTVDLNAHTVKFNKNGGLYSATVDITSLGSDVYVASSLGNGSPAASVQIVSDNWNDYPWTTLNIVAHGDSITLNGGALRPYLPRLVDLIEANRVGWAQGTKVGINGVSWNFAWSGAGYPNTMLQDAPLHVDNARNASMPNWLIAFAGTNGFAIAHHSATDEYTHLKLYINARIAAGWPADHIIVCTMLARTGVSETDRTAYNAAIVGDASGIGYKVARLDLLSITFLDGTHPDDASHQLIAQSLFAVMYP